MRILWKKGYRERQVLPYRTQFCFKVGKEKDVAHLSSMRLYIVGKILKHAGPIARAVLEDMRRLCGNQEILAAG